jgi:2-phosphosulfolactate phosphatase
MKLETYFTPGELKPADLVGRTAVVVDVLRATSTMVEAIANGARSIIPVASVDEAARLGQNLDRTSTLLCGERRSERIEGFDLGNSPAEFNAAAVGGKALVMSTTNGTGALLAANPARRVLVGSLLNLGAAARAVADDGGDCVILCAGREGHFALEDAVMAGLLAMRIRDLVRGGRTLKGNDALQASMGLARRYRSGLTRMMRGTAAGQQLIEAGFSDDIVFCADMDRHDIVPELREREISI